MFRPSHLVILFAVFLCVYAAPAAPESGAVEPAGKAIEPKKAATEGKTDLATDAFTYLIHSYRYGWQSSIPGFTGKILEFGFPKSRISLPEVAYYPPAGRVVLYR